MVTALHSPSVGWPAPRPARPLDAASRIEVRLRQIERLCEPTYCRAKDGARIEVRIRLHGARHAIVAGRLRGDQVGFAFQVRWPAAAPPSRSRGSSRDDVALVPPAVEVGVSLGEVPETCDPTSTSRRR